MLHSRAIIGKLIVFWYVDVSDVHAVPCSYTIQSLTGWWKRLVSVALATVRRFAHCTVYLWMCVCESVCGQCRIRASSSLLFDFTWNCWCCRLIYSTLVQPHQYYAGSNDLYVYVVIWLLTWLHSTQTYIWVIVRVCVMQCWWDISRFNFS